MMDREQIVKALECCSKDDCDNCPNGFGNCYANLAGYALDLIRELTESLDRVQKQCGEIIVECDERDAERLKQVAKLTDENERYEERLCREAKCQDDLAIYIVDLKVEVAQAKADTVRKMQERLKNAFNFGHTILEKSICDIIDQIAKEMLEEDT